jgi:hypothetical protein
MARSKTLSAGALLEVLSYVKGAAQGEPDPIQGDLGERPPGWRAPWPPVNVHEAWEVSRAIADAMSVMARTAVHATVVEIPALSSFTKKFIDSCGSVPHHWPHGPGKLLFAAHRLQQIARGVGERAVEVDLADQLAGAALDLIGAEARSDPHVTLDERGLLRAVGALRDYGKMVASTTDPVPGRLAEILVKASASAHGALVRSTEDSLPGKAGPAQITIRVSGLGSIFESTQAPVPCRVASLLLTLRVAGMTSVADTFVKDFDDGCGNNVPPPGWPFPWPPWPLLLMSAIEVYRLSSALPAEFQASCAADYGAMAGAACVACGAQA